MGLRPIPRHLIRKCPRCSSRSHTDFRDEHLVRPALRGATHAANEKTTTTAGNATPVLRNFESAPHELYRIRFGKTGKRRLETAFADVTPGARDVGPDVDAELFHGPDCSDNFATCDQYLTKNANQASYHTLLGILNRHESTMTQGRSIRYAMAFAFIGFSGIVFGLPGGLVGAPLIWMGMAFLLVGANYAFPRQIKVLHKQHGQLGFARTLILLPYIFMLRGTWHILRKTSSEAPFVQMIEGIFIGRRLLEKEYPRVATLVDLTSEFDEHVPIGAKLMAFPILDGAPADPSALRHMAREIAASERPIYIHCAQGHGRTSMVAAAVLIEIGAARDVAMALARIREVRPGAKPNAAQRNALMAAFAEKN
jgi:rhodanese-related sulfurtransferase